MSSGVQVPLDAGRAVACTHPGVEPDPGRDRAISEIVAHFDNARHRRRMVEDSETVTGYRWRECMGCGWSSPGGLGSFCCYRGGPEVHEWCLECHADAWSYRIPWERWYRLIESMTPAEGQLVLAL